MIPGLTLSGRIDLAGAKLARADVRDWLGRAAVWFETVGDAVLDAHLDRDADGRCVLAVSLHPAADDAEIRLTASGGVRVTAPTFPAGPGYHAYLCGVLAAFAEDFGIGWEQIDDPTGFFRTGDAAALEAHFLTALWRACGELPPTGPVALGLPDDHGFTHPGPVLTPTGPRSREWLAAVAADPAAGRDFFPWWSPDADAAFYLGRAAVLLWCVFPWRPPLTEEEGELTDEIAADLEMAHSLDPATPMPWKEWAEVLAAIDGDRHTFTLQGAEPALRDEVRRRAAEAAAGEPVGYRRRPVRVPVGGGWTVEIPGSFADGWDEDGLTWVGWNGNRRITARPGGEAVPCAPGFVEGVDDRGRRVWRLAGVARAAGAEPLAYRIEVADPSDWDWAEGAWRSLRFTPAPASSSVA